jgi:NitT/TauT family transport system substrate-binding protein
MFLSMGCNRPDTRPAVSKGGPMKIRVGYIGITCERPIFCAVENGFFKDEYREWEPRHFIFATRVLTANGINGSRDVTWSVFPAGELGLALDKREVDAIADSEPIGTLLMANGKVRNVVDQSTDAPYRDEYCCAVVVNGKFLAKNPKTAAAATRALLKGAKWVETNPAAATRLSVEKKYLASNPELNTLAISHLSYIPSVSEGESAVNSAATEMKMAGMLNSTTDVPHLVKSALSTWKEFRTSGSKLYG